MTFNDLEDFRVGVEAINRAAREARLTETRLQNTQHVNYAGHPPYAAMPGQPAVPVQPTAPSRPSHDEILSSIERCVVGLHQAGALTDDEFTSKKAELLRQL